MKKKRSKLQWLACLLVAALMMTVGMPAISVSADEDDAGQENTADLDLIDEGLGGGRGNRSAPGIVRGTVSIGYSSKGYNPSIGERTINGYVRNNAYPEVSLYTYSSSIYNGSGSEFKRIGSSSHGGVSPHVHNTLTNIAPNGTIYIGLGTKTKNGGVTSPTEKDVKQLYEYINNGKYQ